MLARGKFDFKLVFLFGSLNDTGSSGVYRSCEYIYVFVVRHPQGLNSSLLFDGIRFGRLMELYQDPPTVRDRHNSSAYDAISHPRHLVAGLSKDRL